MSKKLNFSSHLDAVQGAAEKRPQPYSWYGEDVSQGCNAVMRQEHNQTDWLCQLVGVYVE